MSIVSQQPVVIVLLSVFNGEAYLKQQLDSILDQSLKPIKILVRDDGSTDSSAAILDAFKRQFPDLLVCLTDVPGNLGPKASFSLLMTAGLEMAAPMADKRRVYFSLADQDDVWYPQKLSTLTAEMQRIEGALPKVPVLVHSDLRVVDADLHEIAPSFVRFQGLAPERKGAARQLVSNSVTGCSAMMNGELLQLALPIPEEAMMHDFWLAMVAEVFGKRSYLNQVLLDYRQHKHNTLGARPRPAFSFAGLKDRISSGELQRSQQIYRALADQASAFRKRYGGSLSESLLDVLHQAEGLPSLGVLRQKCRFRYLRDYCRVSGVDRI